MPLSKPRTKFYGCATVYRQLLQDLITFRIHRGNDVAEFEKTAAAHFGVKHAIATPLARMGILLCLRYFLKPGQYVLQSPYTLAEVINMTTCAGGKPLFSDIEHHNGHLDASKLQHRENIGALLVTHLHGIPAAMDEILAFANKYHLPVIEDAAQSAGTKYANQNVGTLGDAGVLSFGILKQLNSIYGGMVLTNDSDLTAFVREELELFNKVPIATLLDKVVYLFRLHALATNPVFSWLMFPLLRYGVLNDVNWINNIVAVQPDIHLKHEIDKWYQHRYSPSQARMLQTQLPKLEANDRLRRANAELYFEGLDSIDELTLPQLTPKMEPTFAHFPIQVPDPENLLRWFNFYGQDVVAQHFANCAELSCFSEFASPCPVASKVADSLILLPTYPGFVANDIRKNVRILQRYFQVGQPAYDGTDRLKL